MEHKAETNAGGKETRGLDAEVGGRGGARSTEGGENVAEGDDQVESEAPRRPPDGPALSGVVDGVFIGRNDVHHQCHRRPSAVRCHEEEAARDDRPRGALE